MQILNIKKNKDGESSGDEMDFASKVILTASCVVQIPYTPH